MKLSLGVVDIPYVEGETRKDIKARVKRSKTKPKSQGHGVSTGDVAEILEAKYGVMQGFVDTHMEDISALLEDEMKDRLEDLMAGAPVPTNPLAGSASAIEVMFHKFLSTREAETVGLRGKVPTQAALDGASSRFKRKKGPRRPSFIDTGLYEASFTVTVKD